ncbi:hypothetical protein [Flavobacterium reichenbachii]|uniref:Uncharacterized protein n=1 Tax=Flavobacterium reichenbachii TaxID=362418 RepID=A0A085ZIM4_9FLAO|nr:hypothetical protein [Flavobacterium reichenbachii]KFF04288.1 hypothetical protein IW19_01545 [Flavobacterium reichenbachii]
MDRHVPNESPFETIISFHKLIESFEQIALSDVDYRSNYAKAILKEVEKFPEFRTGIRIKVKQSKEQEKITQEQDIIFIYDLLDKKNSKWFYKL